MSRIMAAKDLETFERFREELRAEFRPVGALEGVMFDRLVELAWRLQRGQELVDRF